MKGIIHFIFIVGLTLILSCEQEKEIIPRKDMTSILVEVHLMDGSVEISRYEKNINLPDTLNLYKAVLEDYGYTREQFEASLQYYSKNLRKFDRIYQEVLSRLNQMETEAKEEQKKSSEQKKGKAPARKPK
jgi:predicted transposase YdaD